MSTYLDDMPVALRQAYQIVGNQPMFALKNMVRALESMPGLNTEDDELRLSAAKYILSTRR